MWVLQDIHTLNTCCAIRGPYLRTFCEVVNYLLRVPLTVEHFKDRVNRRSESERRSSRAVASLLCGKCDFLQSASVFKIGVGQASGSFHHKFCLHLGYLNVCGVPASSPELPLLIPSSHVPRWRMGTTITCPPLPSNYFALGTYLLTYHSACPASLSHDICSHFPSLLDIHYSTFNTRHHISTALKLDTIPLSSSFLSFSPVSVSFNDVV
ncbi:hypothetical protein F5B18DRAFT_206713 [Nemania serpens]|nr:hypothetical protein F5B18DRAFT_206713 [Nemania serpens]